ncbi:MAG TPA: hypothetical protein VNG33_20130 [Polyangiaceae bacterium]|nr:hypothetical protein [Polyangiaceae bacterium]
MTLRASPALTALAICTLLGCSSKGSDAAAHGGATSGGATSGGMATGGTASGGAPGCVFANSGTSTGAVATGGVATGGSSVGGVPMGGAPLGSGMVPGPVSTRCDGRPIYKVNPNGCFLQVEPPEFSNGGTSNSETPSAGTGGVADCNFAHDAGYGDPLYNDAGDDDECKYHMSWTSTPVEKNKPFSVMVKATNLQTGAPLGNLPDQEPGTVALSRIEPFVPCDPVHLAPTSTLEDQRVTETGPGEFSVSPLVFDESGRWEMRFHFYGDCFNNSATPHAHIAFFVDVP